MTRQRRPCRLARRARPRRPHQIVACCSIVTLALPVGAMAQGIRIGNEFQVNTYTTNPQSYPSVAADADGDFVVAWSSNGQDGSAFGVFARRFSSTGDPLATEFQVNTHTMDSQIYSSVAMDADGDFVVAWASSAEDGFNYGVFARRFSSMGDPLASAFQVNAHTIGAQLHPSAAASASGDFVIAWESYGQDGSYNGVFARRFSSTGTALSNEFQVNSYTTQHQRSASVATDADGDFVVAWGSNGQDGSSIGVFARSFSSAGAPLASEFQVNTYTGGDQRFPSAAIDTDGDFAIVWESYDGSGSGVFARRFSSAGAPLGNESQVNTLTANSQLVPSAAADAGGDFVVAWSSLVQDGQGFGVLGRRLGSAGAPLAIEFQINAYTTGNQHLPSLAADADGHFVVAWQDNARDGSGYGVFAQRFAVLAALDIDGNGALSALTDGLLVLRRFFGFTGSTLTTGAIGLGCTRCDAAAIEPYIAGLGLTLDIDGNGSLGPLTDGLLALRYLFGFTGSTLTTGAIGGGCTRCDAASIEAYLAGLTG